ncbi:MAG: serine hydrolase [Candidatus Pacebacteria bacterium]|nr:serine hydrolase [Candidatus Paceibacterota bacterium]
MLGEVAIIALVILNQFSLISADQNRGTFLGQFINNPVSEESGVVKEDSWSLYKQNLYLSRLPVLPKKDKAAAEPEVNAVSVFVMDEDTDYPLFDKNSKKQMPIASLTKIMTALLVVENGDLEETVTISSTAAGVFGSNRGMVAGEKIKLKELLGVMIIDSNNTAAYALAEHIGGSEENFVAMMNEKAVLLGLENTKFFNAHGLDEYGEDNYSSAYEIAQLIDAALNEDIIWKYSVMQRATFYSADKKQRHIVENTNELLGEMENIYGGKTGYTVSAGECLALVSKSADDEHKIISVILNAEDRFVEMKKVVNWVFNVYRW